MHLKSLLLLMLLVPMEQVETGSRELKDMIKIGLYSIIDFFIEKSGQRSMNIYIYSFIEGEEQGLKMYLIIYDLI